MRSRVLVWDSGLPADRDLLSRLAQCGFQPDTAKDSGDALSRLVCRAADAVLIRANDGAAVEFCRLVRPLCDAPVIVLCDSNDEDVVVEYLKSGADRVLAGPLSRRELDARLGALLTERGRRMARGHSSVVGNLVLDPEGQSVAVAGQLVAFTRTEFRLFCALARRDGRVATHGELLSEVWGPGGSTGPEVLRHYIRYLRQKLAGATARSPRILNQRGVGYRLGKSTA